METYINLMAKSPVVTHTPWGGRQHGMAVWYETFGCHFIVIDFGSRSDLIYSPIEIKTHSEAEAAFDKLVQLSQPQNAVSK